jgi:UDP-N-acetylmuramate--alanine ligase
MTRPFDALDPRAAAQRGPVHFMGIAGAGMSALAELVLRSGGRVTGCDLQPGPTGEQLRALGATVWQGHDATHVADAAAVIVTAAVPVDHVELVAARAQGVPVLKRAHALGAIVNRGEVLAVAGTHGKTTTTAMATSILIEADLDPTGFVGGAIAAWGGGLRPGGDRIFVVEADEYDRSFLALRPRAAVVTSVEADHLDVYGTVEAVEAAFAAFAATLPADGLLAACTDDAGARRLLAGRYGRTRTIGYGLGDDAVLRATQVRADGAVMRFAVSEGGLTFGEFELAVPGVHNVRNALGAIAAARHFGADPDAARRALATFRGVGRRFERLAGGEVVVIDDYAHHPTELRATLATARALYPSRRLIAAFQPHLYSRTRDFADAFGAALASADVVFVTDVYAAREAPVAGVTGLLVADAARAAGAADVRYAAGLDALVDAVAEEAGPGDVVVTMGAGDIDRAARRLAARLGAGEGAP